MRSHRPARLRWSTSSRLVHSRFKPRSLSNVGVSAAFNTPGDSSYGVPVGDVAIVKHMSFWSRDRHPAGVLGLAFLVTLDGIQNVIWAINGPQLEQGAVYQWSGWEVFTTDLVFGAYLSAFSFRASGTLLTPT